MQVNLKVIECLLFLRRSLRDLHLLPNITLVHALICTLDTAWELFKHVLETTLGVASLHLVVYLQSILTNVFLNVCLKLRYN